MNYCQNTRKFLKIFCFIRNYNYFTLIQLQHHLQKNNNKKLLEIQTINQPAFTCLKLTIETLEQRCEKSPKVKHQWRRALAALLLTLNTFHTFVLVFL